MRSMLALQPYSEVVSTQGESAIREDNYLFNFVSQDFLHELRERLKLGLELLHFLLLVFIIDVEAFLGNRFQLLAIELLQLLYGVLVDWVNHVQYFKAFLAQ